MLHRDRERVPKHSGSGAGVIPFILVMGMIVILAVVIFVANPFRNVVAPGPTRATPSFTLQPPATLEPTATPEPPLPTVTATATPLPLPSPLDPLGRTKLFLPYIRR
jgi:hypothetical protein